jgi:tetratricopeptide (TPR) repeat protein
VQHYERAATLAPGNEQYAFAYQAALGGTIVPTAGRDAAGVRPAGYDVTDVSAAVAGADNTSESGDVDYSVPRDHAALAAATDRAARAEAARDPSASERRLADFNRRVAAEPDNLQIVLAEAAYSLRSHRPDVAADVVSASLKRHPEAAALYRMLGAARYQQGDFRAAQVALEQALSLDNADALAYFLMGSTLARLGNADAARQHFAEAARLDPRIAASR